MHIYRNIKWYESIRDAYKAIVDCRRKNVRFGRKFHFGSHNEYANEQNCNKFLGGPQQRLNCVNHGSLLAFIIHIKDIIIPAV